MYTVGICLPLNMSFSQNFFCLSGPKEIGCKFCTSHVVEDILRFFQPLTLMYGFGIKPSI